MFFSSPKKKKMGIFGAAMVPEKTCTLRLCTHKHTKNVIALTLRERDVVVYTFQTASVCRLSNTSLLPLTLLKKTLCMGVCFLLAFHFVSFVQLPTRLCVFSFLKHLSPLRKFLFFDLHSCSTGWHFYYYTHIYIIIHI
uniref:Uncharacterized protein n=1 Tax=Rhipicephalus microplus TaxID=6941 RepID=A0A6G5AG93_RHIMP